ncbi:MAG: hypothetical protein HQK66_13815 [Desulfamplus sp.]|nr:hypothetical protein [Desulfamplus sp.]
MNKRLDSTKSVGRNLTLSLIVLLMVVVTLTALIFSFATHIYDQQNLEKKADELMQNFVRSIEDHLWNIDLQSLNKISDAYFMSDYLSEMMVQEPGEGHIFVEKKRPEDGNLLYREASIFINNIHIADVTIGISKKLGSERLESLFHLYFITIFIILIILIAVTSYLLKTFLDTPFKNLIGWMELVSEGKYDYHFSNTPLEKEFTAIVNQFKEMALKISEREKSLNRARNPAMGL